MDIRTLKTAAPDGLTSGPAEPARLAARSRMVTIVAHETVGPWLDDDYDHGLVHDHAWARGE